MNRAQRRREQKERKRNTVTYNLTRDQLDKMVREEVERSYEEIKKSIYKDALNEAMVLCLTLPLEVLKDHYWKKSFKLRIPGFIDRVLDLYDDWNDGLVEMETLRKDLWECGGLKLEKVEK